MTIPMFITIDEGDESWVNDMLKRPVGSVAERLRNTFVRSCVHVKVAVGEIHQKLEHQTAK